MGVSDHYRGGMTERLLVTVVTVNPATSRVEVVGKDAAVIQINVSRSGAIFLWPNQGEIWSIVRENGEWALEEKLPSPDNTQLSELLPGEALVQADVIWTPSGKKLSTNDDLDVQVTALDSRLDVLESGVPVVTALPGSPIDKQEIYFQNAAMATDGIIWHLRYRSAGGTYKWEYVGGGSLYSSVVADQAKTGGGVAGDLTTVGPSIVLPLAGDYEYEASVNCYATSAGSGLLFQVSSPPGTASAQDIGSIEGSLVGQTVTVPGTLLAQPSGREVRIQYFSAVSNGQFRYRKLIIIPIRVG